MGRTQSDRALLDHHNFLGPDRLQHVEAAVKKGKGEDSFFRNMELKNKKILVVGLARTGLALVRFLAERGARVKVSEAGARESFVSALASLGDLPVEWEWGGHTLPFFAAAELIIVSPGVPSRIEVLQEARRRGIPVVSEVEVAFQFLRRPLIGITGTNGKTTTTTLVGEMLRASGQRVFVGGNIGNPLIAFAGGPQEEDWVAAEMSSFQLEGVETLRPRIAVLLNLTEDHLDRYVSFSEYCQTKGRIFARQTAEDYALLNADDPLTLAYAHTVPSQVVLFSRERKVPVGCSLEEGSILYQDGQGRQERFDLRRMKIRGVHNLENFMAALATAKICGCPRDPLQRIIDEFQGLEHRLEWVRDRFGVRFFNDSKGTNVGSVVKSLMSFEEPIWLIAGGRDKDGDYGPLKPLVAAKVKGMALIGEAKERIFATLGSLTETVKLETLEEAVHWTASKAAPGDVVLLSPACSSFDMFTNYQERGEQFKRLVRELPGGKIQRPNLRKGTSVP
jgi:UDP-N-acetylmuramoylalanine--D-glutamate ligase